MDGKTVREIRRKAMLIQEEFGKEIGVSVRTVSKWETGAKPIGLKNQRKIVEFCQKNKIEISK